MRDLLNRNADVFSKHKADIGCCNFVEHEIELEEGAVPHREGARRMTPHKSEACRAEIEMLLEYDMIEPSKSPWACGVVMAKKKGGQLRFCCHFRYLNEVTINDAYPIPRIDESLSKLGDAKFFTSLDLGSAFWQVPLRKKDREKTGFACELGLYQWKRMPFGLCNATATFQRLMAQALTRVTKKYGNLVMCYVDDVVIATPTLEDHIDRLDEVFGCMKRAGLKCKPSKCEILRDSIKYLGRMVDRHASPGRSHVGQAGNTHGNSDCRDAPHTEPLKRCEDTQARHSRDATAMATAFEPLNPEAFEPPTRKQWKQC